MTVQTQSNDQEVARLKTMRTLAVVLAVAAMAMLVYGFGMGWKPWFQVPAGLAAWASVEWQRNLNRKIKALSGTGNG